jgi:Reverse transcriptase (RNA-dependent DNA polymerase)
METIQLLISQATQNEWLVHQMDVKSAFLNGVLEEEVYRTTPRVHKARKGAQGAQIEECDVRVKASPESVKYLD